MKMKYNTIYNADVTVSAIGLGTWVFGGDMWGSADEHECMDAVNAALDCGITLIDTAPIYGFGRSEEVVGKAIKGHREKLIVATKCGILSENGRIINNLTPKSIQNEIEQSLTRLQTDYIDIYQCHWPDPNTPIETTIEALCALREKGTIKHPFSNV